MIEPLEKGASSSPPKHEQQKKMAGTRRSSSMSYLRQDATGSPPLASRLPQPARASVYSIEQSQCSWDASKLRLANSDATFFKHRRDEILHGNFQWKTFRLEDERYPDDAYLSPNIADSVSTLECWNYERTNANDREQCVRFLQAGQGQQFGPDDGGEPAHFDQRFTKWLEQEGEFAPLLPIGVGALEGGLRLALCDRPLMDNGMTIRREIFEAIERKFELHDATLPAFTDNGGCFALFPLRNVDGRLVKLQIVVKAVQKVEITNCLLSLTYDVSSCWTNAIACGDSLVLGQRSDIEYGSQQVQLLDAIALCDMKMWRNPLLLPVALLQMCTQRTQIRTKTLERRLHQVERALGVVNAGWVVIRRERPEWPVDIDIKRQTTELHSTLPQILFLKGVTQWQRRYAHWLLQTAKDLKADLIFFDQRGSFQDLIGTIELLMSSIDGMLEFFEGMEGRTQSQINLLFSVVGQRDAINSQKANDLSFQVARSSKEDSISMTTFTFITALFLPPSFIASMFSMGLFEWTAGRADDDSRVVSRRFWIFWAVAMPLTITTLAGWYGWYGHANRVWQRKLDEQNPASMIQNERKPSDGHESDARSLSGSSRDETDPRGSFDLYYVPSEEPKAANKRGLKPFQWIRQRRAKTTSSGAV